MLQKDRHPPHNSKMGKSTTTWILSLLEKWMCKQGNDCKVILVKSLTIQHKLVVLDIDIKKRKRYTKRDKRNIIIILHHSEFLFQESESRNQRQLALWGCPSHNAGMSKIFTRNEEDQIWTQDKHYLAQKQSLLSFLPNLSAEDLHHGESFYPDALLPSFLCDASFFHLRSLTTSICNEIEGMWTNNQRLKESNINDHK